MTSRSWQVFAAAILVFLAGHPDVLAATAYSKADRVNVRSRPGFVGEIVTQLKRGQAVTVLDTIPLRRPAADEPPIWIKIELPSDAPAWANAEFVDPTTGVVKGDILNVRAGPTYDHGIVGRAKRGSTLKILAPGQDGWVQVAAPAGSVGFVPATWLTPSLDGVPPGAVVSTRAAATPASPAATSGTAALPASPAAAPTAVPTAAPTAVPGSTAGALPAAPPTNAPVTGMVQTNLATTPVPAVPVRPAASAPPVATAPGPASPSARSAVSANAWLEQFVTRAPTTSTNAVTAAAPSVSTPVVGRPIEGGVSSVAPPPVAAVAAGEVGEAEAVVRDLEPAVPESEARWVRREGLVVRPMNITAPSFYALKAREGGRLINFLIVSQGGVDSLREYRGRVVIVTGREYLDGRPMWQDTPLLDVEAIEAVR